MFAKLYSHDFCFVIDQFYALSRCKTGEQGKQGPVSNTKLYQN